MEDVKNLAARFAALGHEARLRIVRQLLANHPQGQVVGEMQRSLDIPGSTLSHHLDALHHERLITKQREGRFLRYRADSVVLRGLLNFLYAECCQAGDLAGEAASRPGDRVTLGLPGARVKSEARGGLVRASGEAGESESAGATPAEGTAAEGTPAGEAAWRAW